MSTLLHVSSSPRGAASESLALASVFLDSYRAMAIYTSGVYSPGAPIQFGNDFHATFVSDWLRFVGVTDITEIRFQPTLLTASPDEDRATARAAAREAGKTF